MDGEFALGAVGRAQPQLVAVCRRDGVQVAPVHVHVAAHVNDVAVEGLQGGHGESSIQRKQTRPASALVKGLLDANTATD
jgi:hypothetical protein